MDFRTHGREPFCAFQDNHFAQHLRRFLRCSKWSVFQADLFSSPGTVDGILARRACLRWIVKRFLRRRQNAPAPKRRSTSKSNPESNMFLPKNPYSRACLIIICKRFTAIGYSARTRTALTCTDCVTPGDRASKTACGSAFKRNDFHECAQVTFISVAVNIFLISAVGCCELHLRPAARSLRRLCARARIQNSLNNSCGFISVKPCPAPDSRLPRCIRQSLQD